MTLSIDLFTIAEGATADAQGKIVLVGILPQHLVLNKMDGELAFAAVVLGTWTDAYEEGMQPGRFGVQVTAPDGEVIFLQRQPIATGPRRFPDLPLGLQLLAMVQFLVAKPGDYTFTATLDLGGSSAISERTLKIHLVDEAMQFGVAPPP